MNRILNILVNPFFLSAIFTTVIILLLPPVFDKFNLDLKQNSKLNWDAHMFYFDLDSDGNYLENKQLEPDYKVRQDYDIVVDGRDQLLEKAVEVLLEGQD